MRPFIVAVSTTPHLQTNWSASLVQAGYDILPCPLEAAVPARVPNVWVVALDARHQPVRLSLWLGQLPVPLVLITPHLTPGQLLCGHVPYLRLVCHPLGALNGIGALVEMAHTIRSGTQIVAPESCPEPLGGSAWG